MSGVKDTHYNFDTYLEVTKGDATAAALLVLSDTLQSRLFDFDHQICMGVRYALFGTGADSGTTLEGVTSAIDRLAEAVEGVKE